jgi:hypothetical protein
MRFFRPMSRDGVAQRRENQGAPSNGCSPSDDGVHSPFGTLVRIINLRNNKAVTVRITNRGPFIRSRIIDVSRGAARRLDMMKRGVAKVRIEVIQRAKE